MRQIESTEKSYSADFRWNVAAKTLVGERNGGDSVLSTDDSGPVAGRGVEFRPVVEKLGWVGSNGSFEGEERKTIGVERRTERRGEGEKPNEDEWKRVHFSSSPSWKDYGVLVVIVSATIHCRLKECGEYLREEDEQKLFELLVCGSHFTRWRVRCLGRFELSLIDHNNLVIGLLLPSFSSKQKVKT